MGGETVTEEPPQKRSFTSVFERDFPYFLSLGMTHEQYWYGHPLLVRDYLQAEVYRRKNENYSHWLAGIYMRDAIMSSIGNAFIAKGSSPYQYPDKPMPVDDADIEQARKEQEAREIEDAKAFMQLIMKQGENWGKDKKKRS